jgi:FlaA1/EpsC-like NDP-sugar epimerase
MIHLAGLTPELDIPIRLTGLRPGEKLHESLVCSTEKVIPTEHPKIMAVCGQLPAATVLSDVITTLSEDNINNIPAEKLWAIAQHGVALLESSQDFN